MNSYTVANPFCPTGAGADNCSRTGSVSSPLALMSTDPSNQANMFTGTVGIDLPLKSRYMGTLSYNMMRQNDAFLPFTITAFPGGFPAGWVGNKAAPVNSVADLSSGESGRQYQYPARQQRADNADHARTHLETDLSLL